jgi:hypothetical protein
MPLTIAKVKSLKLAVVLKKLLNEFLKEDMD